MFIAPLSFIVLSVAHGVRNKLEKLLFFGIFLLGVFILFKTNSIINLAIIFVGMQINY